MPRNLHIECDSIYQSVNKKADVSSSTLHTHPAESFGMGEGHVYQYECADYTSAPFRTVQEFTELLAKPATKKVAKAKVATKKVAKKTK